VKASTPAAVAAAVSLVAVAVTTRAVSHYASALNGIVIIPGFADIRFALNRGVSFSLLAQDSYLGTTLLTIGTAAVIVVLCLWAYRTTNPRLGMALGMIIGGALYNTVDRALHGGVFDFLYLHLGAMPLFVCNTADIAITIGVMLLLLDSVLRSRATAR